MAVFLFVGMIPAPPAHADDPTKGTDPEPVQYVIEDIQGTNVQVREDGAMVWDKAEEGQVVDSGDEVKVGDGSEATLSLQNETTVHLNSGTDIKVDQIQSNETQGFVSRLALMAGNVLADVKKHLEESHSTFEIESNGIVCGVRGTAFEVNAQGGDAQVSTHEGLVEVGNGSESHPVEAGNFSSFHKGKFLERRALRQAEMARFQKWRAFRQMVWKKRAMRLLQIRNHQRKAWKRRHAVQRRFRKEWKRRHN
jgi:hypothetical protein